MYIDELNDDILGEEIHALVSFPEHVPAWLCQP